MATGNLPSSSASANVLLKYKNANELILTSSEYTVDGCNTIALIKGCSKAYKYLKITHMHKHTQGYYNTSRTAAAGNQYFGNEFPV